MYQKLEDRLKLYEQDHPIKDDDGLISAIEVILNEQESLPVGERDFDLIAEATDSILKLQGYRESDRATMAEEAAASVRTRIARQKGVTSDGKPQNKHRSVLRWIIPLVAVLAITTVAVFASPTNRLAISEITNRIYSTLTRKTVYNENNIDIIIGDDKTKYSSFKELSATFHNSLLLPFDLENNITELTIEDVNLGNTSYINISFKYNNTDCFLTFFIPTIVSDSVMKYNALIGQTKFFMCSDDEYTYAEWINENIYYQVKSSKEDIVKSIIEKMRLKNE